MRDLLHVNFERKRWKRKDPQGPVLSYGVVRAESPRGVVAIVHGYADHAVRYERVMQIFAERGLTSVAVDLRGHGRSDGLPGHVLDFSEYIDDFRELVAMLDVESTTLPRFVLGHSFGAVVALKSIFSGVGSFRAAAFSDPYLGLALEVPKAKVFAGEIMSKVWPSMGLPSGLKGTQMVNDPEVARGYDGDSLSFKLARARWFTETVAAQAYVMAHAPELKLPLRISFGGEDPVAKLATAQAFYEKVGSTDKTWETLPGLKHEPLSEPSEGAALAARIADWFIARL